MHIELYNADLLNFVEFNVTGDNDNYNRCDEESKYLDSPVFYLFQPAFEEANKTYDYFAGTKYNSRKIIVLLNALKSILNTIESFNNAEAAPQLVASRDLSVTYRDKTVYIHFNKGLIGNGIKLKPLNVLPEKAILLNNNKRVDCVVDLSPSDHIEQKKYLHLRNLPVNELANSILVVKLVFKNPLM